MIINAAPGGSFVGLGALLFAGIGMPITAVLLFQLARAGSGRAASGQILRWGLVTLALPLTQLGLLALVSVFRLLSSGFGGHPEKKRDAHQGPGETRFRAICRRIIQAAAPAASSR